MKSIARGSFPYNRAVLGNVTVQVRYIFIDGGTSIQFYCEQPLQSMEKPQIRNI